MAQLITEAKRFQKLAGILNENTTPRNSVKEGFNLFLEIMEHDTLSEGEGNEKINNVLKSLGNKGAAYFATLDTVYDKIKDPKAEEALKKMIKYIVDNNLTPDQVKQQLGLSKAQQNEAEGKQKSFLGRLGDSLRDTVKGKILAAALLLAVGTAHLGPAIKTILSNPDTKIVQTIADKSAVKRLVPLTPKDHKGASDVDVKAGGKSLSQIDGEDNTVSSFVKFQYAKGKSVDADGNATMKKIADGINKILAKDPKAKISVEITGTASNTTGKANKGTDTDEDLSTAREKTIEQNLKSQFPSDKYPNVDIKTKSNSPNAFSSQAKEPEGGVKGAGAVVVVKADITPETSEKEEWSYMANLPVEKADWDSVTSDTGTVIGNIENDEEPNEKGEEEEETPVVPAPAPVDVEEFSKLNRNGQIAVILKTINPNLDISKALNTDKITSYTDSFLESTEGEAKKLANLIINIRKNPDTLLKKVSKATGVTLEPRAKAISTRPSAQTQAQIQPVKENQLQLLSILQEAMVDNFVQDEDINRNKKAILTYLGSMYASAKNTQLSIIPKDEAEKEELESLGFTPQQGGNYVFLGNQTKDQALDKLQATNKTKPDVERVARTIESSSAFRNLLLRINDVNELSNLLLSFFIYRDTKGQPIMDPGKRYTSDLNKVKGTMYSLSNRIPSEIKEAGEPAPVPADVQSIFEFIDGNPTLKNLLLKINEPEEFIQLWLRVILGSNPKTNKPFLNPTLVGKIKANPSLLKTAIAKAANESSKYKDLYKPQQKAK
jgi:hypothetical protein